MPRDGEYVTHSGEVKRLTDRAVLFLFDDDELGERWVPLSVIHDGDALDDADMNIDVARWWLERQT